MPELAEVEYYRKQWSAGTHEVVQRVRLHPQARIFRESNAAAVRKTLTDKVFTNSVAHGKKMLFRFSEGCCLGIHLGMSGSLSSCAKEMVPSRHEHLVLIMESCALVLTDPRMFGKVLFHQGDTHPDWWSDLPPQPQDTAFDQRCLNGILKSHPRQPLKALLLNQSEFPGIGNWLPFAVQKEEAI
jgi:formamidopyrimidine-DNA glycosylase